MEKYTFLVNLMRDCFKIGTLAALIVGMVIMSGCTNMGSTTPAPQATTISTSAIPTISPATTTQTLQVQTSTPVITTIMTTAQVAYSTNDINKHFIDIAFSPDYSIINKWNQDFVDLGISGTYNDADVILVNNFSKLFNSYSSYTKLQSEITKERMTANIVLRFMPESSLKNINYDNSWKVSQNRETGTINYIYKGTPAQTSSETIYINSDLKGNSRNHWILRALLFELGFPGETGTYPDSMFYSESDAATSLNKIDLKALELMYGKKISYGMDLTQVRQLLQVYDK